MRLRIPLCNRIQITSLLTEGGKPGTRVVGAVGVNVRTGEFYVFKAKATIYTLNFSVLKSRDSYVRHPLKSPLHHNFSHNLPFFAKFSDNSKPE